MPQTPAESTENQQTQQHHPYFKAAGTEEREFYTSVPITSLS